MTVNKHNSFFKTPKGKLVIALFILLGSWIFMLSMFWNDISNALASESDIKKLKAEVEKARESYDAENLKKKEADKIKENYLARLPEFWLEDKHGEVELTLREKIENAATKNELKLASIGTVRISRINNDLYYAEIDFSLSEEYGNIITFISELEQIKPRLAWRRLEIRPEYQRPQHRGPPGSPQAITEESTAPKFRFSGAVRITGYDGELTFKETDKK